VTPEALGRLGAVVAARLAEGTAQGDARRLFHGRGGRHAGLGTVVVDRFGPVLRVGVHGEADPDALAGALAPVCDGAGIDGAWFQRRDRLEALSTPLWGAPAPATTVREHGLVYRTHPAAGRNAGLFLDAAPVRRWLAAAPRGSRVLNLFAYTASLSVAALAGGATSVVNVDMARGALRTGEANHQANGLTGARFLPHDVFASWGRLKRLGPFDLVILDPPTNQGRSFVAERDWPKLLRRLPSLLGANGRVLTLLNAPFLGHEDLARWMAAAAPGIERLEGAPAPSPDFDEADPEAGLKIALWGWPASRRRPDAAGRG
jgi:23S rRNA (cytosine1962-C5)-methyltransferase